MDLTTLSSVKPLVVLGFASAVLLACSASSTGEPPATTAQTTTSVKPRPDEVSVSVRQIVDAPCAEVPASGYDDVPGSSIQIKDGLGTVIGYVNLRREGEPDGDDRCVYTAFTEKLPMVDIYQVGNDHRGFVT